MAHRHLTDTLRIQEWNANGILKERLEFAEFTKSNSIDIALIAETKLSTHTTWRMPNYSIYRTDGPTAVQGGTAIVIKNNISHTHTITNGLTNVQLTTVEIHTSTRSIIMGALYNFPSKDLLTSDLDIITSTNNFIIGGDFNAKDVHWNSRTTNKRGRTLLQHYKWTIRHNRTSHTNSLPICSKSSTRCTRHFHYKT